MRADGRIPAGLPDMCGTLRGYGDAQRHTLTVEQPRSGRRHAGFRCHGDSSVFDLALAFPGHAVPGFRDANTLMSLARR